MEDRLSIKNMNLILIYFSNIFNRPILIKAIIGSLCLLSVLLTIALTVVVVLYLKTFGEFIVLFVKYLLFKNRVEII